MEYVNYLSLNRGIELWPVNTEEAKSNENGIVFLYRLMYLRKMLGILNKEDKQICRQIIENLNSWSCANNFCQRVDGLYDRQQDDSKNKIPDTMSHDNINAIIGIDLYILEDGMYCKKILKYLSDHYWTYNNQTPYFTDFNRIMHPRDIIFWSYLNKNILSYIFLPYLILEMILSCCKRKVTKPDIISRIVYFIKNRKFHETRVEIPTSGKLLWLDRAMMCQDRLFGKIMMFLCKKCINFAFRKEGGIKFTFNYYFKNQDHPINKMAERLYDK